MDTAFVARLGVPELAALGVDSAILGFAFFGFNFLAHATTPLVAQALGRGDEAMRNGGWETPCSWRWSSGWMVGGAAGSG
ncbi:MAG TPA: MATE family efflux transporter, partial [Acidimicrobiia bacterium]|nr:MATE family efflux transporter [Acidimicrobiia bacterium]